MVLIAMYVHARCQDQNPHVLDVVRGYGGGSRRDVKGSQGYRVGRNGRHKGAVQAVPGALDYGVDI